MSGDKHLVTVGSHEVDEYIARGYEKSHMSARDAIGSALFELVDKKTQGNLVVMQIDKDKHEAQNKLPQAFMVQLRQTLFAGSASVCRYDVMERGLDTSVIALSNRDARPQEAPTSALHATAREAVLAERESILYEINAHREAADRLETFLKKMEAL